MLKWNRCGRTANEFTNVTALQTRLRWRQMRISYKHIKNFTAIFFIHRTIIHVQSVWTIVQKVLTATFNSYGNRQISTHYKIDIPELINKKVCTFDYVHERTPYTIFGTNPPTEGFCANGWNITNKKLRCRREAARCFLFVCSQLKHTYSAVFLLLVNAASDLLVHKILLNSDLLSPIVSGGVRPPPGQTPLGHNPHPLVCCRSWVRWGQDPASCVG